MRKKLGLASLMLLFALFLLAEPAAADNCGSLSDCYRTMRAAVAATVGLAVFAAVVSFGLDLIPGVGQVKGIIEAVTGRDLITGAELAWYERALGVVPIGGALIGGAIGISRGARRAGEILDLATDASRLADRAENAGDAARTGRLIPGTPEHKAARWQRYQERNGQWTYERWSKQYDTNMQNVTRGLGREVEYRTAMGGQNRILTTPHGNRQIDIYIPEKQYAGQLKTGKQALTAENRSAIERDKWLVESGNLKVEWILEKGGSEPLLKALREAGIDVHIGPKIP